MAGALLLALNVCGQENVPVEKKVEKKVTSENHDAGKVNFKVSADVVSSYIWSLQCRSQYPTNFGNECG